jgi:hypothetical protein
VSHAPPTSMQTVKHQIEGQRRPPTDDEPNDWQVRLLLSRNDSRQMLLQMHYMERAPPGPRGKKRPVEESTVTASVKTQNPCTCRTCHKADCPGNFMSRPCKYKLVNLDFTNFHTSSLSVLEGSKCGKSHRIASRSVPHGLHHPNPYCGTLHPKSTASCLSAGSQLHSSATADI